MRPRFLSFTGWLFNYNRKNLQGDVTAGLTVAVMLIPQAMAYAMLAGLPPITGLYASVVPLIVYALFGSSRQLAVGPVAMVSLLVAAGVGEIAETGKDSYIAYAILLAFMIGIIQFLMGVARIGFLVNFISHPVISGFTSAAALIIGFSQLKHLLGVEIPRSHHIHSIILAAFQQAGEIHFATLIIGVASIAALYLLKKYKPIFPGALTVVVSGILLTTFFDLGKSGIKIVGEIPRGLPAFHIPLMDLSTIEKLLPIAIAISLVSFMESISVAKAMASRYRHSIDANQELIGLGLANIFSSFFQGYPVTGGFSRTAVNAQAGAKTGLASIITAIIIAITLLFLTPLLHNLPQSVLAAIIMMAVFGLVDIKKFFYLLSVKRVDAAMLLATFIATLMLGIEPGILIGVGLSLALFIVRTTRPHYAILGKLPGTTAYRNIKYFPEAELIENVAILRIDASFYFGNADFLQERIEELINQKDNPPKAIVIDASSINYIDSSAAETLEDILRELKERDIKLLMANLKGPVREVVRRSGFYYQLGAQNCFFTIQDAVDSLQKIPAEHRYASEVELESTTHKQI